MLYVPNDRPRHERIAILNRAALIASGEAQIRAIARMVRVISVVRGTSTAVEALRWVQSLGFRRVDVRGDGYLSMDETIAGGGDCKALSVLLVALLTALGYPARASWLDEPENAVDHVAVLVRLKPNSQFVWADPSIEGARLGENPHDAAFRLGSSVIE